MLRPKKNSYKEYDNEKKFLRLKNSPPPPHNFSNGPSLYDSRFFLQMKNQSINQSTLFKYGGKWLSKLVFKHAV